MSASASDAPPTVRTLGHSDRSVDLLVAILLDAGVRRVVDVRRFPRSRRHPHFAKGSLALAFGGAGLDYAHLVDLGGRREPAPGSPNTALSEDAFRGYADHMATPRFAAAFRRFMDLARDAPTAVLCAEADPARCHRRLLADLLELEGGTVLHEGVPGAPLRHRRTPQARLRDGRIVYGGAVQRGLGDWLERAGGDARRETSGR